jgi:hypothetical protein
MRTHPAACWSRRDFLHGLTMAGTSTLLGLHARPAAAEPPPETTTLKLAKVPSICGAPLAMAEELFKAEGFSDVQFIQKTTVAESYEALAAGELHFNFQAIGGAIFLQLDAGVIDQNLLLPGRQMRQHTNHVVPWHRQDHELRRRGFFCGHRRHTRAQCVHRVA